MTFKTPYRLIRWERFALLVLLVGPGCSSPAKQPAAPKDNEVDDSCSASSTKTKASSKKKTESDDENVSALNLSSTNTDTQTGTATDSGNSTDSDAETATASKKKKSSSSEVKPSYETKIKDLLEESCVGCHKKGGSGPGAMTSYSLVKKLQVEIVSSIEDGSMPPEDEDPLSEADKKAFISWKKANYPESLESAAKESTSSEAGSSSSKDSDCDKVTTKTTKSTKANAAYEDDSGE